MLPAILGAAGLIGSLFGKQAKGAAEARQAEGQQLMTQDQLRNQQFNTQQNAQMQAGQLDLQRKNFEEDARGGRAKQALIASLLGNMQDANVSVPGIKAATVTGGIRPSAIGAEGRTALGELAKQALAAQVGGDQFSGGQLLQAPALSQMPKASGWEKLAGILGTVGQIAGGVGASGLLDGVGGGGGMSTGPAVMPQGLSKKPYEDLFTS